MANTRVNWQVPIKTQGYNANALTSLGQGWCLELVLETLITAEAQYTLATWGEENTRGLRSIATTDLTG